MTRTMHFHEARIKSGITLKHNKYASISHSCTTSLLHKRESCINSDPQLWDLTLFPSAHLEFPNLSSGIWMLLPGVAGEVWRIPRLHDCS